MRRWRWGQRRWTKKRLRVISCFFLPWSCHGVESAIHSKITMDISYDIVPTPRDRKRIQDLMMLPMTFVGKNEGTKSDVTKISSSPSVSLSTPRDDPRASLDIWEDTPRCPSDAQDVPMTPVTSTSCPAMSWGLLVTDPATPAAAFFLL